jgi:hypothetical protein
MTIKYVAAFLILSLAGMVSYSQDISKLQCCISENTGTVKSVDLYIDHLIITLNQEGAITSLNNTDGGQFEYWGNTIASGKEGKLKSIGNIAIDYWHNGTGNFRQGKIKSIGNYTVEYWPAAFASNDKQGKIKSIGNINFDYYANADGSYRKGKLKTIHQYNFEYWGSFTGKDKQGKLKSIGNISLDYWPASSGNEKKGKIKSIEGNTPGLYVITE